MRTFRVFFRSGGSVDFNAATPAKAIEGTITFEDDKKQVVAIIVADAVTAVVEVSAITDR